MNDRAEKENSGCAFSIGMGGLAWVLLLTLFAITGNCSCLGFDKDYVEKWSQLSVTCACKTCHRDMSATMGRVSDWCSYCGAVLLNGQHWAPARMLQSVDPDELGLDRAVIIMRALTGDPEAPPPLYELRTSPGVIPGGETVRIYFNGACVGVEYSRNSAIAQSWAHLAKRFCEKAEQSRTHRLLGADA